MDNRYIPPVELQKFVPADFIKSFDQGSLNVGGTALFDMMDYYYGSPDRHYHNWGHLQGMLILLDRCERGQAPIMLERFEMCQLAILFHDVIYDVRRKDNEEASAKFAMMALKPSEYFHEANLQWINDCILATKHNHEVTDAHMQLICDFDLHGLGSYYDSFRFNTELIRKEFVHVPTKDFYQGRIKWVESMIAKPKIFYNPFKRGYWDDHELSAKTNLKKELEIMKIELDRLTYWS